MRNLKRVLALALALVMMLGMMITASAASYADAAAIDEDYAVAVEVLTGMGVFKGQGAGFAPKATLTRAEAAALIYRVITADVKDSKIALYDYSSFKDVAEGNWATGYITYAANGGYVKGDGTGNFLPNAQVTGVQVLAIMLRAAGYGQKGEFEGAAWKDNVLTTADDLGLLDNVKANDLDKPATRELVAQLIWDALWAPTTTYTPAFGYWPSDQTLGDKFGLAATDFEFDAFMRPSYGYTYTTGDKATMWNVEPIAEFKTKINECDLSSAVGEKGAWAADIYSNGVLTWDNETIVATATTTPVNGTNQGTLTQVYNLGTAKAPVYHITEIETWLAKVDTVKPATYDKAGHQKTAAETKFDVYDGADITYETTDYAKGSYVLLTWSGKDGNDKIAGVQAIGLVDIIPTTPVATEKLTGYNVATTTVGATYMNAYHFSEGKPASAAALGTTYNVFVDLYGNVIGLVEPQGATNYGILDKGIEVTNGWTPYYLASLVTTDGTTATAQDITVAKYNPNNDQTRWDDRTVTPVNNIVTYTQSPAGYVLVDAGTSIGANGSIVKGTPRIYNAAGTVVAVTDPETVYVVETAEGVFSAYTGYANVPSISNTAEIEYVVGQNGYVDLVYINAIAAVYPGSATMVFIDSDATAIGAGVVNYVGYTQYNNVVINGEYTTVDVRADYVSTFESLKGNALYLVTDANGLVCNAITINWGSGKTVAEDASAPVIYFVNDDHGYIVDAVSTTVWVIDTADNVAEIGDVTDLAKGATGYATVAKDGQTLDKVIIWGDLEA